MDADGSNGTTKIHICDLRAGFVSVFANHI